MFCGYCGKQADDGVKFCPYCGKPMQAESAVVIETEENITTSETTKDDKSEEARSAFIEFLKGLKKAKKLIIAAVVVLVVIIAGVSVVKSQNSVVGTWEYSYGYYNTKNDETKETEDEKGAIELIYYSYYTYYYHIKEITFYSDGTFRAYEFDGDPVVSGTYNIINDGKRIELCYNEREKRYEIDRKGNTLIFGEETPSYYKKTK